MRPAEQLLARRLLAPLALPCMGAGEQEALVTGHPVQDRERRQMDDNRAFAGISIDARHVAPRNALQVRRRRQGLDQKPKVSVARAP
jgi:hypothetical protein